jgi:hypothetical protein
MILRLKDFYQINEGLFDELGLSKISIFRKALTDPFIISILPDIKKMMDANPEEQSTWINEYKNIFRKSCVKFGGANKSDINKTCNKPQTLQKLAEHLLDPSKGIISQKDMEKWASDTTEDKSPSELSWPYSPEDFDKYLSKEGLITKILLQTGITAADLKKTGTYLLEKTIPTMLKFYTAEDLGKSKFLTDGTLIDPARAKELIGSGKSGGSVDL